MAELSKVNVNSTDYDLKDQKSRDALVDTVNNGAKNLSQFNSGTAAADNVTLATGIPLVGHAGELLVFSYETTLSSGVVTVGFKDANGNATGSAEIDNVSKQKIVTIPEGTAKFNVFVSKAGTYTNFMICTKAEWDISQAYVPYVKTNAELTNDTSTLFTENTRQETEIGVVANAGAKNFAIPFNATSATDISVTSNADGSYTFECTDVAENRIIRVANIGNLPSGAYKFSGTTGGSSSTYMLGLYNTSASAVKYQHTNAEETYTGNVSGFSLRVRVISGYSGTFTVYPMLRPAAITDPTFQPYARTNRDLTVLTDEDRASLVEIVDGGSKNKLLCNQIGVSGTFGTEMLTNGVRFTLNADGTITANRESASSSNAVIAFALNNAAVDVKNLCDGLHILSGCPSGGAINTYRLYVAKGSYAAYDTGTGVVLSDTTENTVSVLIVVSKDYNSQNLIFRPMICSTAAWKISHAYQPYRPSWQEMYDRIVALENQNT